MLFLFLFSTEKNCVSVQDCDDDNVLVWKLNSCDKCAIEPTTKEWSIDNVIDNPEEFGSSLLKELLDEANKIDSNLNIKRGGDEDSGAKTTIFCNEVTIGGNLSVADASSSLAFELTHINNSVKRDLALKNLIENKITGSEYLDGLLESEIEGFVISNEVRRNQSKDPCSNKGIEKEISNLTNYDGKSLSQIKSELKSDGTLNDLLNKLKTGVFKMTTSGGGTDKYIQHQKDTNLLVLSISGMNSKATTWTTQEKIDYLKKRCK